MRKKYIKYCLVISAVLVNLSSCKKFVETDAPSTQANADNVYTNDATAIAVLTGIYTKISQGNPGPNFTSGLESFSLLCGLSADEYFLFTGANSQMQAFYQNALIANMNTNIGTSYWNVLYDHIYSANSALEGLNNSNGLTEAVKLQLIGEAKFIRAFCYFYLVNLYGEVPLVLSTNYQTNLFLSRSPSTTVFQQIISDLKDAEELLSLEYLDGKLQKYNTSPERVRPNKLTASALLARAYLYNEDWVNAENSATEVIKNNSLYDTVPLSNVFLRASNGNKEAIWQLQVVASNQNTDDSKMFILSTGLTSSTPVRLSDTLVNSFEVGDNRKKLGNWVNTIKISGVDYYYPYKYKNNTTSITEYVMVMRLAEQYLIRAEARAQQNKISEAQADLNLIRKRARLSNTIAFDKPSLLTSILHERQIELFSEWGHRWLDLKRTKAIDALMTIITPKKANASQWQPFKKLYPIPFNETQRGPNLKQTDGYL